ncbi:hypothetical protein E7T06_15275 [Deinococcus sp. Arct2-2]|uniref:glycosyl-4,4'-diaponeurosporenoate acyltransferase CrtO family protein n=1 Tax=Deinococcus sp. Arct2-2 TaxID=2568653 RepID=UPI0010A4E200|nr:hypothetical protein [Deinococcus sp. Arct2-2]THF68724.1 hypothetical protein E7T06_15275 [Deinococcus sp. Arct2-2]
MHESSPYRAWLGTLPGLLGVAGVGWLAARVFGLQGPLFAVAVHIALMRWALFVLKTVRPQLRSGWFRVRDWEAGVYRGLGVMRYMGLLRTVGWERFRRSAQGFSGVRASLGTYERATREAEFSHVLLAGIGFGLVLGAAALGQWNTAAWLLGANLFFQVYPVLLQRTMRARLQRLGVEN